VRIPRLLVLTDRTQCTCLPAAVESAVAHGARAVVLREKDLPPDERASLADALRDLLDPVGGLLILAGRPDLAGKSLVDGSHLAAGDPVPAVRPPILGRSCHDAAELARATGDGCDYVTLSPVFPSPSKPGYGPPLGPAGLAALRSSSGPLVYALGGVTPDRVAACRSAGAYGVAAMGSAMREPRIVADFLSALESTSEDA
jgi:thiamine-phosphate pyrophosphorylase